MNLFSFLIVLSILYSNKSVLSHFKVSLYIMPHDVHILFHFYFCDRVQYLNDLVPICFAISNSVLLFQVARLFGSDISSIKYTILYCSKISSSQPSLTRVSHSHSSSHHPSLTSDSS